MARYYFQSQELRRLNALHDDVKKYLLNRFDLKLHEWITWAERYEWNNNAMIDAVNDTENKPD